MVPVILRKQHSQGLLPKMGGARKSESRALRVLVSLYPEDFKNYEFDMS